MSRRKEAEFAPSPLRGNAPPFDDVLSKSSGEGDDDSPLEGAHSTSSSLAALVTSSLNVAAFLSSAYSAGLDAGDRILASLEDRVDAALPAATDTEAEDAQFLRQARRFTAAASAASAAARLQADASPLNSSVIDLGASSADDVPGSGFRAPRLSLDLTGDASPTPAPSSVPPSPSLSALARSAGIVLRPPGDDRLVVPRALALSARLLRRLRRATAHSAFHLRRRAADTPITHIDLTAWLRRGGVGGVGPFAGLASAVSHGVGAVLWPTQLLLDDLAKQRVAGTLSVAGAVSRAAQAVADAVAVVTRGVVVVTARTADGRVAVGVGGGGGEGGNDHCDGDGPVRRSSQSLPASRALPAPVPTKKTVAGGMASRGSGGARRFSGAANAQTARGRTDGAGASGGANAPIGRGQEAAALAENSPTRRRTAVASLESSSGSGSGSNSDGSSGSELSSAASVSASSAVSGKSSASRLMRLAPPLPGQARGSGGGGGGRRPPQARVSVALSSSSSSSGSDVPGLPVDTAGPPRKQPVGGPSPRRPARISTGAGWRREADTARQSKALVSGVLVRTVALSTADSESSHPATARERWGAARASRGRATSPPALSTDTFNRSSRDRADRDVAARLRRVRGAAGAAVGFERSLQRARAKPRSEDRTGQAGRMHVRDLDTRGAASGRDGAKGNGARPRGGEYRGRPGT